MDLARREWLPPAGRNGYHQSFFGEGRFPVYM